MTVSKHFEIQELVENLGGFGRFQIWVFFLGCYASGVLGLMVVSIIFVGYEPRFRCLVPECESYSNATYDEDFLNFTTPFDSQKDSFQSCFFYDQFSNNTLSVGSFNEVETCDVREFNMNEKRNCSHYVYDTSIFKSSTVMEYNLGCERNWLQPTATSAYMVGMLIGAVTLGDLADRIGRRKGVVVAALIAAIGGIAGGLSVHYYMFLATRVITGAGTIAVFQIVYVLATEYSPSEWRTFVGIMIDIPFAIGEALIALFAYYIREWRVLYLATSLPILPLLLYLWIMPESLRWLDSKGNFEEMKKTLHRIEKVNKLKIPEEFFHKLSPDEGENITRTNSSDKNDHNLTKEKRNLLDIFRYPNMRKRTLNLIFCWAVVTLSYYGLSANSAKLGGNLFVSVVAIMLIEIPSYLFAYVVLDRIGRKGTLCFTLFLGGIALLAAGFTPSEMNILIVTLSMIGKFGISAAFAVVYVYTVEIYPTPYRSLGLGTCSMSARIGGILAPFIADLDKIYRPLPPFIFGILAIISGFLIFLLPETVGSELPQTLEKSENFGTEQNILYFSCWTKKRKISITTVQPK